MGTEVELECEDGSAGDGGDCGDGEVRGERVERTFDGDRLGGGVDGRRGLRLVGHVGMCWRRRWWWHRLYE